MSCSLTSLYTALNTDERVIPALRRLALDDRIHAYLVGGCVRDGLLGREVSDIDLVIRGDALSCARAFAGAVNGVFVLLDAEESVGRVVVRRRLTFDMSPMKGTTLEEDLARRDFTINAMALRLSDTLADKPELIDMTGGMDDLRGRRIAAISEQAFMDDPLRSLRAFRFAAQLEFAITRTTVRWLSQHAVRLSAVSPERIQTELSLILAHPQASRWICRMYGAGVLQTILPEINEVYPYSRPAFDLVTKVDALLAAPDDIKYLDLSVPLSRATNRRLSGGRNWNWLVRLAALFIGDQTAPPRTEPWISGIGTERLRLSRREHRTLHHLIRLPIIVCGLMGTDENHDPALFDVTRNAGDETIGVVLLALAVCYVHGLDEDVIIPTLARLLWLDKRRRAMRSAPRLITGDDLMTRFALDPGPGVGALLARVEVDQATGRIRSREDAFAAVHAWLSE